jgi:hypothetical protein
MKTFPIIALVIILSVLPCYADWISTTHHCHKPIKPYKFTSEWEIQFFKDEVDAYKECIEDFVRKQNEAIENHQNSAKKAIREWNDFVTWELR